MNRACPPCDYRCQGGKSCPARGGNYYAEYAENTYLHLREPAALAESKPHIAPQDDEPLGFCAVAVWKCIGFAVGCLLGWVAFDWARPHWATVVAWIAP